MGQSVYILSACRTAIGNFQGNFSTISAPLLAAAAIKPAVSEANITPELITQAVMGCVLSAGLGQAPARQATLAAGLSVHVAATTINKMCGSGMQAAIIAHDAIKAGSAEVVVAGGMENMSNTPYLVPKARAGLRLGHGKLLDHMFLDGLEDAYETGRLMGEFAEDAVTALGFTREQQDDFALESLRRAQEWSQKGLEDEIRNISVKGKDINRDELPDVARPDKIRSLKPVFKEGGTITPANASAISDGAAALVLASEQVVKKYQLIPIARIVGHAVHAGNPADFPTAPIPAIKKLCQAIGWSINEVDLFEINEAFAVVTMAAIKELALDPEKVNARGGACALGHPIGATGARIMVSLLAHLRFLGLKKGIASLCIGGGEATAIAMELL
ncbi:MAG: acetyl-CoA C-acyltransferase [Alphaproteobacteria bacterium]